jgi:hypothetical protein
LEVWPQPVCGPKTSPSWLRVASSAPRRICLSEPPTHLDRVFHPPAVPSLLRPPITQSPLRRNRTINLLPFAYASRPPLRCRLTLGGLTFPRNPWAFGAQVFHLCSRYSCRHSRFRLVQPSSRSTFTLARNAPLPRDLAAPCAASVACLAPLNCPRSAA